MCGACDVYSIAQSWRKLFAGHAGRVSGVFVPGAHQVKVAWKRSLAPCFDMMQATTKCPPKRFVTSKVEAPVSFSQTQRRKLPAVVMVAVTANVVLGTSSMMAEASCPPTASCSKLLNMLTLNDAYTVLVMKVGLSWTLCGREGAPAKFSS
mmetsp:Transcript_124235/g.247562  ORF Transcript_124235/g.247562 Transcript_124235/m.247562 type:complete len:151 (-) Transcript_124235:168-620(-)